MPTIRVRLIPAALALLIASDLYAQSAPIICYRPFEDTYKNCLDEVIKSRRFDGDMCVPLIKSYIDELRKWRACQIEQIEARRSREITDVIDSIDGRIANMNHLMYCIGSAGKRGAGCASF